LNKIHNPEGWTRPRGYSNVISATGRMVFIAGQIGWNENQEFESDDFVDQTRQALANINACLKSADSKPAHIVRMTWYVVDKQEYLGALPQIGKVYREQLGQQYPTMSLVEVSALVEDRAKLEIEVTAVIPE